MKDVVSLILGGGRGSRAYSLPSGGPARDPLWFVRDRDELVRRFVLSQVLDPGFHEERFQHASFFGSILKHPPRIGAVAAALLAELFDGREKRLTVTRIDAVFDRDEHRTLIALDIVRKHRRRPVH